MSGTPSFVVGVTMARTGGLHAMQTESVHGDALHYMLVPASWKRRYGRLKGKRDRVMAVVFDPPMVGEYGSKIPTVAAWDDLPVPRLLPTYHLSFVRLLTVPQVPP
ncbi:hypothetical protein BC938DRAFT_477615, partial [Jimgerdemannia flammicorona]